MRNTATKASARSIIWKWDLSRNPPAWAGPPPLHSLALARALRHTHGMLYPQNNARRVADIGNRKGTHTRERRWLAGNPRPTPQS